MFLGIWLHVEGANTPAFDSSGFVTGPDSTGTMIDDMRSYLDFAQSKNILVIFVLWNGAYLREQHTIDLFWDEAKLQSYIDKALKVKSFIRATYLIFGIHKSKTVFTAYGKRLGRSSSSWCLGDHERAGRITFKQPSQQQSLF